MSDICYCGYKECKDLECHRHWENTKKLINPCWITWANFKESDMCPHNKKRRGMTNGTNN